MSNSTKPAICIFTYKNRYSTLLNYTNKLIDEFPVFIVFSKDDPKLSEYDEYVFDERIVKLYVDAPTLGVKKQFAFDYLYDHGYEYVMFCDDDLEDFGMEINESTKRTTSDSYRKVKIPLETLFDRMYEAALKYNSVLTSTTQMFLLGFATRPGSVFINNKINFGQLVLYNIKRIKEKNIVFDTRPQVHDDIDFGMEILRAGLTSVTINDICFVVKSASQKRENSTMINDENLDRMRINLYLKYRDGLTLRVTKKGELALRSKLENYWNTYEIPIIDDPYHNELVRLCKEYDIEGLKQHILSKKIKKKKF